METGRERERTGNDVGSIERDRAEGEDRVDGNVRSQSEKTEDSCSDVS
mgnify:CR=1 FL=1